jgi:D-cysteine desulfhydrase
MTPSKISLALKPTPLEFLPHLTLAWQGPRLWVKRDDLTGFELSGNKVRKLEYHLAAAIAEGADTVITAGAVQSNHCRATALSAARLGLACILVIRTSDGQPPALVTGNHRLHQLAGARIVYVDPDRYRGRDNHMADLAAGVAEAGGVAWVIPEGASDALGMLGMADAYEELHRQLAQNDLEPAAVWHASSSAGTTAGFGWGRQRIGSTAPIIAVSVGDPAPVLSAHVERLWTKAVALFGGEFPTAAIEYRDDFVAGGYAMIDPAQPAIEAAATAATGLLFDPTYTGKALFALHEEIRSGRFDRDDDVVFWHTGGGFAALA